MEFGPIWRASMRNKAGALLVILQVAFTMALIVNAVRPNTVRFAPPLTITAEEVGSALDRFADALR